MKSYPAHISISQLAELTGRDRRTITQRLEGLEPAEQAAVGARYEIRAALRLIFEFETGDAEGPDQINWERVQPHLEKAKLDFRKREEIELEMQIKRRELVPKDEIKSFLGKVFGACRSRLLNVPVKAAQQIHPNHTRKEIEAILREITNEALAELSEAKLDGLTR